MSYDGFGRLASSHRPEQRDGSTLKYTTYSYNPDDSISQVTDARGAVTSYGYNSRGLVEGISWAVPQQSEIDEPAPVGFEYDNAGNRTEMTDGLGTVTYSYDSLSRMTAETREFTDALAMFFIGVRNSSIDELRRNANTSSGVRFNSTGWRNGLYDSITDNQARHFIGGLLAGFRLGENVGSIVMGYGEDSAADIRVNAISIGLGARLGVRDRDPIVNAKTGMETSPGTFDFRGLARRIRDAVCEPDP